MEINKILIKCPAKQDDTILAFPFLIALSEEFPKAEISLLCEEECSLAYNFLPFKVKIYERPQKKLSLIETHHYCANLDDIFNIDLFFDLENSLNSAFMGFNFRARHRVGFGVGWSKYFLTKKIRLTEELMPIEQKCMRLLEAYTGKNFQDLKISRVQSNGNQVEKIEQLFKEPEPPKFIMVMLDNFQNVSTQIDQWKSFFDSFQAQKFIIWSLQDQELISELFANIDLGHNDLYMHKRNDSKELVYLLNKVKGVVTNNFWSEALCNYMAVNTAHFISELPKSHPSYQYFHFKPQRFFFNQIGVIKFSYLQEERELLEMNQVVDHIHFYFKL